MSRSKFGAIKTEVDGIVFASKKEANRYCDLKVLVRARVIGVPTLQPEYRLEVNGVLICKYRADFRYLDKETGAYVVEDTKGFRTPEYRLKKKLMLAIHGIEIKET